MVKRFQSARLLFLPIILMLALDIGVLALRSPVGETIPPRDPGVFLYTGWRILNGGIPYRDVWDHKPPAVFYIDAVGLWIGGGKSSLWGVWFIETLSLFVATVIGFMLLQQCFGSWPAAFATFIWLITCMFLEIGNTTEEFCLPFQFASLYLFSKCFNRNCKGREFMIGLFGACAFLLKQNLIGVWLSITIYLTLTKVLAGDWQNLRKCAIRITLGVLSVIAVVSLYFVGNHAFNEFWDAAFRYNFIYASVPFTRRLETLLQGLIITLRPSLSLWALVAWIIGIYSIWRGRDWPEARRRVLDVSLIGLPIEFYLSGLAGVVRPHYFIAWLPVCAVLIAFLVWTLTNQVQPYLEAKVGKDLCVARNLLLIACLVGVALSLFRALPYILVSVSQQSAAYQAIQYIKSDTQEQDYVLMWGAETTINFVTQRRSPSRFVYQYPLYMPGYHSAQIVQEFYADLKAKRPIVIVDTSSTNPLIPPIDAEKRRIWSNHTPDGLLVEMKTVFDYISSNYRQVRTLGKETWSVYMLSERALETPSDNR